MTGNLDAKGCEGAVIFSRWSELRRHPGLPSRVLRQASVYVRRGGCVRKPEDLKDTRVGVAEWGMIAVVSPGDG